jgi:hypothetical protein
MVGAPGRTQMTVGRGELELLGGKPGIPAFGLRHVIWAALLDQEKYLTCPGRGEGARPQN